MSVSSKKSEAGSSFKKQTLSINNWHALAAWVMGREIESRQGFKNGVTSISPFLMKKL
jgi:hypothetical protein